MAELKIGRWTFRTRGEARREISKVLQRQPVNVPLIGDDFELIRSLLDLPGMEEKLVGGVRQIVVRMNKIDGLRPQPGFWVVHDDETSIDFSIYSPFKSRDQKVKDHQSWAAREAVRSTVLAYKTRYFSGNLKAPCEVSGNLISWDEADVHHAGEWSFKRIHSQWLQTLESLPDLIDTGISKLLRPPEAASFVAFHDAKATLQVVEKRTHRRLQKS